MSGHRAPYFEEVVLGGDLIMIRHVYDLASDTYCAETVINGETFSTRSRQSYAGARHWLLSVLRDRRR